MKTLIISISFVIANVFCYGQSEKEKSVYSIKKDALVFYEEKPELKMDSAEYKSKTSVSIYKNRMPPDVKDSFNQNTNNKESRSETIQKSKPKDEIEKK